MTNRYIPPAWIKAYDGGPEFWPPYWDRAVLVRILDSPLLCRRLEVISEQCGEDVAREVMEACLSVRGMWEGAPKASTSEQDKAVKEIRGLAKRLVAAMGRHEQALRAYCAVPLTVEALFPEPDRAYLRNIPGEASPLYVEAVLHRLNGVLRERTDWEGGMSLPSKPNHSSAFRTYAVRHLIRLLRDRTGSPQHSVIADLVNAIIDEADNPIHPTHVAKLDPGG
ncbi:hypothetical protein [Alicycliphilus denitrificans]|uniref:Uncharacterized protein n=1 Tax=Alicycliphilus denitrificans (strain DSM 14773 / CIP 107495 / K601) TaxID=596154 RepID=F4GAS0_ALIDK|nr:hypothetical protein [Alicycliphilus denitrificans]AEB85783.1 hypothetical protein Alide2_3453 [Alicycliphilus denitrificans K601]